MRKFYYTWLDVVEIIWRTSFTSWRYFIAMTFFVWFIYNVGIIRWQYKPCLLHSDYLLSRHMTLQQRRIDVDATELLLFDVGKSSLWCYVPCGYDAVQLYEHQKNLKDINKKRRQHFLISIKSIFFTFLILTSNYFSNKFP